MAIAAPDIADLWDFDRPDLSEERFRAALGDAAGDARLELLTQIARSYSLRARYEDAHRLLDEIEPQLAAAGPAPRVRYLLERGRTFRSGGAPDKAGPLFAEAWELGRTSGLDGLAIDAAHMVALVEPKTEDRLAWNERALELSRRATEPYARNWQASLHNNIGWSLHDAGRFAEALVHFETARKERERRKQVNEIRIAKWAVARCLRSLGRRDEALAIQLALKAEWAADGKVDQSVMEELGLLGIR
ncbi:MAG: tetratricopeptide repeat protein [Betaproteobacteria bacterium]|nr:MAG: tetratricopeptide repeat protein [Betaproteobacteria bacterium]